MGTDGVVFITNDISASTLFRGILSFKNLFSSQGLNFINVG